MFILTIDEPHWLEPIVTPVRKVVEVTNYRVHTNARGSRVLKERFLVIDYPDAHPQERFRINDSMTYTVELSDDYEPIDV